MYSPLNNIKNMWLTPYYIIFKVRIRGIELFGRFENVKTKSFGKVEGDFEGYDTLSASQIGSAGKLIKGIAFHEVVALEAYDVECKKTPTPFSKILRCCYRIEQMETISEETPLIINNLIDLISEFEDDHQNANEEVAKAITHLEDLKIQFSNEEFSEENAKKIKEGVSKVIQHFFQLISL